MEKASKQKASKQKVVFVYNADSGLRNSIVDGAHKIISPSTYGCSLCAITFGFFTENSVWKKFRKETDLEMEFLHKDEFSEVYKSKFRHNFSFPIVLMEGHQGLEVLVRTDELNAMKQPEELVDLLKMRG